MTIPSEIKRLDATIRNVAAALPNREVAAELIAEWRHVQSLLKRREHKIRGYQEECNEVEQVLGKALQYPWYKDDQKNFPGAKKADGVCVGEHVPSSIAMEAAKRLAACEREHDEARRMLETMRSTLMPFSLIGGGPDMQAFHDLDDDTIIYGNSGKFITAGDVRDARRILAKLGSYSVSEMHFQRK